MRQTVTRKSRLNPASGGKEPLLATDSALIEDDRAFDEVLARSALAYVNGTLGIGDAVANPDSALAWVPRVLLERYRRASGIGAKPIKPSPWQPSDPIKAQLAVAYMVNGLTRWRVERSNGRPAAGHASAFEWVNAMLRDVPMLTHWRVGAAGLESITIPQLDNAERCVAYAVGCIAGNRWNMAARVDYCAFVPAGDSRPHLFLADSLKQKFCCSTHANAHRQREFKQAARKHK